MTPEYFFYQDKWFKPFQLQPFDLAVLAKDSGLEDGEMLSAGDLLLLDCKKNLIGNVVLN